MLTTEEKERSDESNEMMFKTERERERSEERNEMMFKTEREIERRDESNEMMSLEEKNCSTLSCSASGEPLSTSRHLSSKKIFLKNILIWSTKKTKQIL